MTNYLQKRGSVYRFRRVVPEDLRHLIRTNTGQPRTEFSFSLNTKDRREAERLCRLRAVETDAILADARRLLDDGEAHRLIRPSSPMRAMSDGELEHMELASEAEAQAHHEWEAREARRQALIKFVRQNDDPATLALRDLLDDAVLLSPDEQRLRQNAIQRSWSEGEAEFLAEYAVSRGLQPEPSYPALMALFEAYVAEVKPSPATVKRWRPVVSHLIAFLGHDDASRLTTANVREWRRHLEAEKNDAGEARAPRTIRETYLAALKTVLNVAVENGTLSENVAKPVTMRVPKPVQLRERDFTDDEALTILRATLAPPPASLTPEHALARRWVPWLCAYTGARVNEMTQLRAEDVRQMSGIWTIRITPDAGSVKGRRARIVPMHPHLIDQGFHAVAEAKGKGPLFYDPRRGRGGSSANPQSKKVGERLAAWVRKLGITDPDIAPNHAWRHTFKTKARAASMDGEAREAIPGHANGTVGQRYGSKPVSFLSAELEKFPRFEVS